eukprot:TRINITY_DN851_c0_g2_i3.p1 TRINITY_DN851_c0_g2~~TRINITY_DN851_c0_g2_i3.p1  ORF type:complete len:430 (+),score=144.00 TRINITY_DN851_c0_g2_i3:67-1356(+)
MEVSRCERTHDGMHYVVLTGGGPRSRTVLLVHGVGCDASCFEQDEGRQLTTLGTVLIPDLLGHGTSSCPPGDDPYKMAAQAAALCSLLQHEDAKDLLVLGWSMGGPIALMVAERWLADGLPLLAVAYAEPNVNGKDCDGGSREARHGRAMTDRDAAWIASCKDLVHVSDHGGLLERMLQVRASVPSVVYIGSRNVSRQPPSRTSEDELRASDFDVQIVPDAGHYMQDEIHGNPAAFYQMLHGFFSAACPPVPGAPPVASAPACAPATCADPEAPAAEAPAADAPAAEAASADGQRPAAVAASDGAADAVADDVRHRGWLEKLGGRVVERKQRRYFELSGDRLWYYQTDATQKERPLGCIELSCARVIDRGEHMSAHCFSIEGLSGYKEEVKEYFLFAATREEKWGWLQAIAAESEAAVGTAPPQSPCGS